MLLKHLHQGKRLKKTVWVILHSLPVFLFYFSYSDTGTRKGLLIPYTSSFFWTLASLAKPPDSSPDSCHLLCPWGGTFNARHKVKRTRKWWFRKVSYLLSPNWDKPGENELLGAEDDRQKKEENIFSLITQQHDSELWNLWVWGYCFNLIFTFSYFRLLCAKTHRGTLLRQCYSVSVVFNTLLSRSLSLYISDHFIQA